MSSLLVGLVVALVAPLVVAGWRVSLMGLLLQGLLMGGLVLEQGPPPSAHVALLLVDLLLVRGLLVPLVLYTTLRSLKPAARVPALRANLFSFALVGVTLFLGLRFSRVLVGTAPGASLVFVSATAFLLGMLLLGTQTTPLSQIVGLLRIENAIALFELSEPAPLPLPIQAAMLLVYVVTVALLVGFLRRLPLPGAAPAPAGGEVTL